MSVFGGDSWAREAQHRKRRVDDLLLEELDESSYKRLSNGKFACLICPKSPILDTLTMLSTHVKGSFHRAAESRCRDREFATQLEVNKRIALSNSVHANLNPNVSHRQRAKPLIELVQKVSSEVIAGRFSTPVSKTETENFMAPHGKESATNTTFSQVDAADKVPVGEVQRLDCRELREMELKFTAAGWKRNCHGRWFKDENVEFDSDEEDPNIIFK